MPPQEQVDLEKSEKTTSRKLMRALFLRCLAGVYLVAFLSAAVQMKGLYGEHGILPMASYLNIERHKDSLIAYFFAAPSIFWFNTSDNFLLLVPMVGAISALLALFGILVLPCLFISWFLYLSIVNAGQEFMSFQWDILLLETGFLSLFFASSRPFDLLWNDYRNRWKLPGWSIDYGEPSIIVVWLYRWLLFRLMFSSGIVKLSSHDPAWADLSAMTYHYWTQPLPTPLGWVAGQFPEILLKGSTAGVFVLELMVPFMVFGTRRIRFIAAILLTLLQVLILFTGNYTFFNVLSIALCLPLLDDQQLLKIIPKHFSNLMENAVAYFSESGLLRRFGLVFIIPGACLIFLSSAGIAGLSLLGLRVEPLLQLVESVQPWNITSHYGLFAVMTTTRDEISVEGSMDGKEWKEYIFRYKPGPLDRAPPIVAPHQPRLDWQMWFAALGNVWQNKWFVCFVNRLLENSPDVIKLLETNPFPTTPPKYIRASLYSYHFTDVPTLFSTGKWWKREYKGEYMPVVTRDSFVTE